MSRSTFRSVSHSTVRIALATTAVVALGVIAACSENGTTPAGAASGIAGPSLAIVPQPTNASPHLALVCIGASSPAGSYTFVNTEEHQGPGGMTSFFDGINANITRTKVAGIENCFDDVDRTSGALTFDSLSFAVVGATQMPAGVVFVSTECNDDSGLPTAGNGGGATVPCGNPSKIHTNIAHGTKVIFNFCLLGEAGCYGPPQFVVGDRASGLNPVLNGSSLKGNGKKTTTLNFWGSQWWKNNPMSNFSDHGWPSFKGYATEAGTCGDRWYSRVGNSPPPPATIDRYITVIVTDKVEKNGPDLSGIIQALIVIDSQGSGYGPNPGHDGNGPQIAIICGDPGTNFGPR